MLLTLALTQEEYRAHADHVLTIQLNAEPPVFCEQCKIQVGRVPEQPSDPPCSLTVTCRATEHEPDCYTRRAPVDPSVHLMTQANVSGMVSATAAQALRKAEKDHGVRFVAVPEQALHAVRLHWEADSDEEFCKECLRYVRDLFAGQDGHLLTIDRLLGPR